MFSALTPDALTPEQIQQIIKERDELKKENAYLRSLIEQLMQVISRFKSQFEDISDYAKYAQELKERIGNRLQGFTTAAEKFFNSSESDSRSLFPPLRIPKPQRMSDQKSNSNSNPAPM